jgi:hypothetical protein
VKEGREVEEEEEVVEKEGKEKEVVSGVGRGERGEEG